MEPDPTRVAGSRGNLPPLLATLLRTVALAALLYVFLFAIALMGAAFKTFGKDLSRALITTTSNPVVGLMIGLLATSLIQSSSSTTSIVVGMVAAGALSVRGAIPIVMGANMGTTITNTVVALASLNRRAEFRRAFAGATMHDFFNLMTILVLFPLEQATHYLERTAGWLSGHLVSAEGLEYHSPVKAVVKPVVHLVKDGLVEGWHLGQGPSATVMLVISLLCLFAALTLLTRLMRGVVVRRAEGALGRGVSGSGLVGMLLGVVVTVLVQSSSITTSLLIPLIGAGVMELEPAFAITLGANIGTTVTALLASLAGNLAAVTVALVHLLFNVTGILLIYPVPAIRRVPLRLARRLALLTVRNRWTALYYVGGLFFGLPLLFVLISRLLRAA